MRCTLHKSESYRSLYTRMAQAIRNGSYARGDAYELHAPPPSFINILSAIASWSIYPVYLALILTYAVAASAGWLAVLTAVPKG
jgi:hypothetical protein